MFRRTTPSSGLGIVVVAVATLVAAVSAVSTRPAAAATCAPVYVSSSGTVNTPAMLLQFPAAATGNISPANTIGGPRNSKMVTASGIAQDQTGFTYIASPHINTLNVYSPGASGDVAPFAILGGASTGLNNPQGIAVRENRLYVANGPFGAGLSGQPSVAVFALPLTAGVNNVAPVAVIAGPATGLISPFGLALDSSGNIFVANVNNTVTGYAPPRPSSYASPDNSAPILTITSGLVAPEGLAIKGNTLYVSNDNDTVTEYSLPIGSLLVTIGGPKTGLSRPLGVDVDASGNIFVVSTGTATDGTGNSVLKFAPSAAGDASPIAVITGPATLMSSAQFVFLASCSGGTTPLAITTISLPTAIRGASYSQTLGGAGGTAPYTWSLTGGSLPAGLSLSSAGVISGTPTTRGTSTFTVKLTDASNPTQSATKTLSLSVVNRLKVAATTLPAAQRNVAYSATLVARGGTRPYTWVVAAGTLPPGLSLSSSGVISGTPTSTGTANFTVKVTDASNPAMTATKAMTLPVS